MITYSSDRNYARVKDWGDVTDMVGFTSTLNPSEHVLTSVIAKYEMPSKVRCGLSNCRTPHFRGYVVVTKSGSVTNIGNHCGKKHFGLEFSAIAKSYEQGLREYEARDSIKEFKNRLHVAKERVAMLRSSKGGIDEVYNKTRILVCSGKGMPDEIVDEIKKMVKARNPKIAVSKRLSEAEIKDMEVIQGKRLPRPYYTEEKLGDLAGLAALYKENDLREIVVHDIEAGFKLLSEFDEDTVTYKRLVEIANWCADFETKIAKVESICKLSIPLFKLDNLRLLKTLLDKRESIMLLEETIQKLASV
jgi:hypothetical protein